MALYETCSDDGKKSRVLTDRLTCEICGNIKPFYNVRDHRPETNRASTSRKRGEGEEIPVCQCHQETCYQWLKRLVGFGGTKRKCNIHFHPGCETTDCVSAKLKKTTDRSSRVDPVVRPGENELLIIEPLSESAIFGLDSPSGTRQDQRLFDAETEEHSLVSKDSKIRKKKQSKPLDAPCLPFSQKSEPDDEEHLKQLRKEQRYIPASTATVFQSFRSRALYILQPDQLHLSPKEKKAAKRALREKYFYEKTKRGTQTSWESLINEGNRSASHVERYSSEETEKTLKDFGSCRTVCFSLSDPQTQRDYQEVVCRCVMSPIVYSCTPLDELLPLRYPEACVSRYITDSCPSCSELCQSPTSNVKMKVQPSGESCFPPPSPLVLSCASPTLQKTSQAQRKKSKQKQGSCPSFLPFQSGGQDNIKLNLFHSHLKSSENHPECTGCKALEFEAKSCQRRKLQKNKDCPNPAKFRSKSLTRSRSSPPMGRYCWPNKNVFPQSMYCQMPLTQNRKGLPKQKKETAKMLDTIRRCNTKQRPIRSCPLDCIGTLISLSPPSAKPRPKPVKFQKIEKTTPRSASLSFNDGFNFSQSSNIGIGSDSKVCTVCNKHVEYNQPPQAKDCTCEISLPPTCVRRGGPRSTVREYLATIDHPKPRFKPPVFASRSRKLSVEQTVVSEAPSDRKSSSGSSKKSKKKKKKPEAATESDGDASTSKQGVEEEKSSTVAPTAEIRSKDGNNNYGLENSAPRSRVQSTNYPVHNPPSRVASLPSYYYTSFLDSGYVRNNTSPYSTSYELRASQGRAHSPHGTSDSFGYLRASQEFRKAIRDNYKQRQVFGDAWRTTSQDPHIVQFQSWSPTVNVDTHMLSPDKSGRQKAEVLQTRSTVYRKSSKPEIDRKKESKKPITRPKSLPQSPQPKESLPQFFPKKSFLEGKTPKHLISEEIKGPTRQKVFDKISSKTEMSETAKPKTQKLPEPKVDIEESKAKVENLQQKVLETAPCEAEENASGNLCEHQDNDTKSCDLQNALPSKPIAESLVEGQHVHGDTLVAQEAPDELTEIRAEAILEGKESSVDYEPPAEESKVLLNDLPKSEPVEATSKAKLPEPSPVPKTMKRYTPRSELMSVSPLPQSGSKQMLHSSTTQQIPVFQNLLDRFDENIQIRERTKDKKEEQSSTKEIAKETINSGEEKVLSDAVTESSKQEPGKVKRGGEGIAAWGSDNQTMNKAMSSNDVPCQSGSKSEVKQTLQPQPTNIVNDSAAVTLAQSVASLTAACGDPCAVTGTESKDQALGVEMKQTSNEESIVDTTLTAFKDIDSAEKVKEHGTSIDEVGVKKTLSHGTYVIKPKLKTCSGGGEIGHVEEITSLHVELPPPLNPVSDETCLKSCVEAVPEDVVQYKQPSHVPERGSSVDPEPDALEHELKQDLMEALTGSQSMFHKIGSGVWDGAIIMSAKSRFMRNLKLRGKSMTNLPVSMPAAAVHAGPLEAVVCKSLDNACAPPLMKPVNAGEPVKLGCLSEEMKKFISLHGTPV